jgi:hypothetical protein
MKILLAILAAFVLSCCNNSPITIKDTVAYKMNCTNDITFDTSRYTRRCENDEVICYGDGHGFACHWKVK